MNVVPVIVKVTSQSLKPMDKIPKILGQKFTFRLRRNGMYKLQCNPWDKFHIRHITHITKIPTWIFMYSYTHVTLNTNYNEIREWKQTKTNMMKRTVWAETMFTGSDYIPLQYIRHLTLSCPVLPTTKRCPPLRTFLIATV